MQINYDIFVFMDTKEGYSHLVVCLRLDNHNPFSYSGDKNYQKWVQKVVEQY